MACYEKTGHAEIEFNNPDSHLLEIAQGDVRPDITVKAKQNVVEACHSIVKLSNVIVRLNLHKQKINKTN